MALLVTGITVLDDTAYRSTWCTQYSPVPVGVFHIDRDQSQAIRIDPFDDRAEGTRLDEGPIGVKHQDSGLIRDSGQRLLYRVTGAELLDLLHPGDIEMWQFVPDQSSAVSDHDMNPVWR